MLTAIACMGCVSQDEPRQHIARLESCAVEYVIAFDVGRLLENVGDCDWSELTDQAHADRIQAEIVRAHPGGGARVGYSVTHAEDGPAVGVLTDDMLLPNGSTVDLLSGHRIRGDGNLLLRVASTAINEASTLEQVARSIEVVIPFVDSSDSMLADSIVQTRALMTATNGNTRWLVLGDEIDLSGYEPADRVRLLAALKVELIAKPGISRQEDIPRGNPLQAVLSVLADLRRRDAGDLQTGDLVAVGAFGAPHYPKAGADLTAVFNGLTETPAQVESRFR